MELVEGNTLADRIARGPIPVEEAIPIARQIAEALEAAHDRGVIHRDLKPANVKITADGQVKVLDFGLAKLAEDVAAAPNGLSMSPTLSVQATVPGVILGTAAYMSPEQARGKPVDRRTDIWAFSCVLFEMLTAERAFPGEDLTETLAAIVKSEPRWEALPAGLSPALRAYLRRCLHKDPKQRVGDIRDMRLALEGAFEASEADAAKGLPSRVTTMGRWIVQALAVAAMIALAIPAVIHFSEPATSPAPEMRLEINTPVSTDPLSFALSPDGQQLVFVASDNESRLWLRRLASTEAQRLESTEGARSPFWSPDSRSIAFFAEGSLKRFDLAGGRPRVIASRAATEGGTWNRDGVILFQQGVVNSPLFRISADGGEPIPATVLHGQIDHDWPHFSTGRPAYPVRCAWHA